MSRKYTPFEKAMKVYRADIRACNKLSKKLQHDARVYMDFAYQLAQAAHALKRAAVFLHAVISAEKF